MHTQRTLALRPTVPVILAGGTGTRLWPLSRTAMPKQFQPLTETLSPYQLTLGRVMDRDRYAPAVVVTTAAHRDLAVAQATAVGAMDITVIVEPAGRNTAPAILAAAMVVADRSGPANLVVLPSDHLLRDGAAFDQAMARANELADVADMLVTFGITPTHAETGYGYIRAGAPMVLRGAALIDAFVEKPNRARAEAMLAEGGVYWNSGMFCFPTERLIDEAARLNPIMVAAVRNAVDLAGGDQFTVALDAAAYGQAPSLPIDIAVMEKTDSAAVIPMDADWSDIGSFAALWDTAEDHDDDGNVLVGPVVTQDAADSYIRSDGRLTTVVGLRDVVVVSTEDAVLVADKAQSQAIKPLVETLAKQGAAQVDQPAVVHRPWGTYQSIDRGEGFQVKHIMVAPGGRLSLQYHHHRAEHWTVVGGEARITIDDTVQTLGPNQSVYIPLGAVHRLENLGDAPVHLIEVQCGDYLGEDDIVRVEDIYGRTPAAGSDTAARTTPTQNTNPDAVRVAAE